MKKMLLILLALAVEPSISAAADFSIKQISLGSSESELQAKYLSNPTALASGRNRCKDDRDGGDRVCVLADFDSIPELKDIAGYKPKMYIFRYVADKMSYAVVMVGSTGFADVAGALKEKYGEPSSKKQESIQNRAGATFVNNIHTWAKPGQSMSLTEFYSSLDKMALQIKADSYDQEVSKRAAQKAKLDAGSL